MKKSLVKNLVTVTLLSFFSFPLIGQQLYIVGSANNPATPELYIQGGDDGFVYVQGGVKATGNSSPNIIVNGGLFIKDDGATPGNIENGLTGADLRFDKEVGATPVSFVSSLAPTADADKGGTVHLISSGTQQIIAPDGQKVHFYNLNLNDNTATNALREVIASSGTQTYVTVGTKSTLPISSDGKLLLGNEYFELDNNVVEVRNTDVQAIERDGNGTPTANDFGLDIDNQEDAVIYGTVAANTNGRLGRMSDGSSAYLFPLTESNTRANYRPAVIIGGGAVNAVYYATLIPSNPNYTNTNPSSPSIQPYTTDSNFVWRINGPAGATPEMRLYDSEGNIDMTSNGCPTADLIVNLGVAQSEGANYTLWTYEGGGTTGQTSCPTCLLYATSNTGTINGTDGLIVYSVGAAAAQEGFTLAQKPQSVATPNVNCNPLHTSLESFEAIPKFNAYIELDWKTDVELNSHHFEVERGTDGVHFTHISNMNVNANGSPSNYTKNDMGVQPNIRYYYRLKMVDTDGTFQYSKKIVNAMLSGGETTLGAVYPNPTNGEININIYSIGNNDFTFNIYNAIGQVVWNKTVSATSGVNVFGFDLSHLAYGTYELVVKDTEGGLKGAVKLVRY